MVRLCILLLVCFVYKPLQAQLCEGSLGDPIVNITFGSGANPGPPLNTTANLAYFPSDCPNDGQYTVRNGTTQCFSNTWHTLYQDHSGKDLGYFMLINASLQQSEFYIDTVRGLCANTTYEFAAWLMNIILPTSCFGYPIAPNITFNIETASGTVLQTYSTGIIAASSTPLWQQYGFFFKTPNNTSDIVLRMINNSQGGCGNDLAIDDITFRPCGPKLTTKFLGYQGNTVQLCQKDTATVELMGEPSPGYANPTYQWQTSTDGTNWTAIAGATKLNYKKLFGNDTPQGRYYFRLLTAEAGNITSPTCRLASNLLVVDKHGKHQVANNSPTCTGKTVQLAVTGGVTYTWKNRFGTIGSTDRLVIDNASIKDSGYYSVTVVDEAGCTATDSTYVTILQTPAANVVPVNPVVCEKDQVQLIASGGSDYRWFPGTGLSTFTTATPFASPDSTITYNVVVRDSTGCADTANVTVNVLKIPKVSAGPNKEILAGEAVQLQGEAQYANRYSWSPTTNLFPVGSLTPMVAPPQTTKYILTAVPGNNCPPVSDTTTVTVYDKVLIPNAFSPNGDGVNDTWNISGLSSYSNYRLTVYNRFGQKLFETKSYIPWNGNFNGKLLPTGVYYYLLELNSKKQPNQQGYVTLLK